MSKRSLSTRSLAIGISAALLVSTTAISTASAQSAGSPSSSSSSSDQGSSAIGTPTGYCETDGEYCEADNGIVQTSLEPVVVGDQVTTTIEIEGLRTVNEDLALTYSATDIEVTDLVSVDADPAVTISEDNDIYSIVIEGGLQAGETTTLEATGTILDEDTATQSVTVATGTPADAFVRLLGGLSFGAIGIFSVIEHLYNINWMTEQQQDFWLSLTGRNPNLV